MRKILVFTLILVIVGQLNGFSLRKFNLSFRSWKKEVDLLERIQDKLNDIEIDIQAQNKLREEERRIKIILKHLVPGAGRTSVLKDLFSRF